MMTTAGILKASVAALFSLWALWTEWRLRNAQDANEVMRRTLDDQSIKDSISSLSDDSLRGQLSKDFGGGPPAGSGSVKP